MLYGYSNFEGTSDLYRNSGFINDFCVFADLTAFMRRIPDSQPLMNCVETRTEKVHHIPSQMTDC